MAGTVFLSYGSTHQGKLFPRAHLISSCQSPFTISVTANNRKVRHAQQTGLGNAVYPAVADS